MSTRLVVTAFERGFGRLAPHARRRFNAAQCPAQLSESNDLLFLRIAQDIRHVGGRAHSPFAERELSRAFQIVLTPQEDVSWAHGR